MTQPVDKSDFKFFLPIGVIICNPGKLPSAHRFILPSPVQTNDPVVVLAVFQFVGGHCFLLGTGKEKRKPEWDKQED